ncbi:MAG: trigger factor [Mycoplasmoidaceae bacterium]|nr:MAG: trigger factor [Mycoplasmoidaceae bacterium]
MDYEINNKKISNNKIIIDFKIKSHAWEKTQASTIALLAKNVKVSGFRPGKAPIALLKQNVGETAILERAANTQINNALKTFIDENDDETILTEKPNVEITEIDESKLFFTTSFDKLPEITLPDYKKFKINVPSMDVTDDEIEQEFNRLIKKDIMLVPKESGKVEHGNSVNIDFIGYKDGVAFPGGAAKNHDLVIGSNSFIPGFEEKIIGMNIDESKKIKLSFPQDYHAQDLAGKAVEFDVKLNAIHNVEKPDFNEEYFSKFKIDNVKTEKHFKEYLKKQLSDWKNYKYEQDFQKEFAELLIENTKLSYFPDSLIELEKRKVDDETSKLAANEKMKKDEYIKTIGYENDDMYQEGLEKTAKRNIILVCAIEKIASELKIKVEESDIKDYIEKVKKLYNLNDYEAKKQFKNTDGITAFLFQKKTFDKIFEFYKK